MRQSGVDFAIVLSDKKPENLDVQVIRSEQLCFCVSPTNDLRSKKEVTVKNLKTASFVAPLQGREYTKMIDSLLGEVGLSDVNVAMRVSNWESIQEAVRAGLALRFCRTLSSSMIGNQPISELSVKGVNLKANIMLLEHTHRHFVSPSVALVKECTGIRL